ncbi:MAG: tyrosine-type recombinase/integrase [Fusobacteriaceae bacterium]
MEIIKKDDQSLSIRKKRKEKEDRQSVFNVYRSQKTLKDYLYYLTTFLNYVYDTTNTKINPDEYLKLMTEIEKEDVEDYIAYLVNERKLKKTSVNTILSGLKSLFRELEKKSGHLSPCRHLTLFKTSRDMENILKLSYQDIKKILSKYEVRSDKTYRNTIILQTLFYTGMRSQELLALKFKNFLERDGEYFFRLEQTKSGREQFKPVHEFLVQKLFEYKNYLKGFYKFSDEDMKERFIFPSSFSKNSQLTYIGLNQLIQEMGRVIDKNISPHNVRHAVATELSLNGADILEIRDFLGHSASSVTEIYINAKSLLQKRALKKIPVPNLDS